MRTDQIIDRLEGIKRAYSRAMGVGDVAAVESLTAAIEAMKTLEQVKEAAEGHCDLCKYSKQRTNEPPCKVCAYLPFTDEDENTATNWEFRWPLLGDEADENK